jgi:hypothetical protein
LGGLTQINLADDAKTVTGRMLKKSPTTLAIEAFKGPSPCRSGLAILECLTAGRRHGGRIGGQDCEETLSGRIDSHVDEFGDAIPFTPVPD